MSSSEIDLYEFDEFRLDTGRNELLKDEKLVPLTNKAFQLLTLLVRSAGQTVGKDTIYEALWADSFVEDANLTQHIYKLRKTLGSAPSGGPYIETIAKTGYRFTADV